MAGTSKKYFLVKVKTAVLYTGFTSPTVPYVKPVPFPVLKLGEKYKF
jgi:hypothetical protein